MCRRLVILTFALVVLASSPAAAFDGKHQHGDHAMDPRQIGAVKFPISCGKDAQVRFNRATAMLHSFWYEEAQAEYSRLAEAHPDCAIAYWGVAMTRFRPLWYPTSPQDLAAGAQELARAEAAKSQSPREADYIAALKVFYSDTDKLGHKPRHYAYRAAMQKLHEKSPNDTETAIFYAHSLLEFGLATEQILANAIKAGDILQRLLSKYPNHPGIIHYLIHSYDYPQLASRALKAARLYARVAPAVPHARHMPSHIFTRLGYWEEAIASDLSSAAAAKDYMQRTGMKGVWDQWLHPMDYLAYAYLQTAQDEKADEVLKAITGTEAVPENAIAAYAYAAIPSRLALERRNWKAAAAIPPRTSKFPWTDAIIHFARAVGNARLGQLDAAKASLAEIEQIQNKLAGPEPYWSAQVEVMRTAAAGWVAHAAGNKDEALKLLASAADKEDAIEKHPVTPGWVLPAREQYADALLEYGKPAEALAAYEASLKHSPNRFRSTAGAAQAAKAAGDPAKAAAYNARLAKLAKGRNRPELAAAVVARQ